MHYLPFFPVEPLPGSRVKPHCCTYTCGSMYMCIYVHLSSSMCLLHSHCKYMYYSHCKYMYHRCIHVGFIQLTLFPLAPSPEPVGVLTTRGSQSTLPSSLSSLMLSNDTVPAGRRTSRRAISLLVRLSVPTSNSISSVAHSIHVRYST